MHIKGDGEQIFRSWTTSSSQRANNKSISINKKILILLIISAIISFFQYNIYVYKVEDTKSVSF